MLFNMTVSRVYLMRRDMFNLLVGFAFFVITIVHAASEDDVMSCLELFNPENVDKMCCESFGSFDKIEKDSKECIKEDSEDWQCEDFECILRKNGMLKDNKIDEDSVRKYFDELENENPKEKNVIDKVRNECLDGKYNSYPPEDVCPVMKFYVCVYINVYLECDSWKSLGSCSKMAENAKKCKAALGE